VVGALGKVDNQAKTRWNAENYAQVKISVAPEVASAFKAACAASHTSMAGTLSQFMAEYQGTVAKRKPEYATRRQRRTAIKAILQQMELIRDAEIRCRDAIPENLQGSIVFENADECVSLLDEAIELIGSIY